MIGSYGFNSRVIVHCLPADVCLQDVIVLKQSIIGNDPKVTQKLDISAVVKYCVKF